VGELLAAEEYAAALSLIDADLFVQATSAAWTLRGRCQAGLRQWIDAEASLRTAIALDPSGLDAYWLLAQLFRESARPTQAAPVLREIAARLPLSSPAACSLIAQLIQCGDRELGCHLAKVLADSPQVGALVKRDAGNLLFGLGAWTEAADAYRKSLQLVPEDAGVWFNLSLTEKRQGQMEAMERSLRRALQANPEHFESLLALADRCDKLGQAEVASELYKKALAQRPNDVELHFNYASMRMRCDDVAGALAALGQARSLNPDFRPAREMQAHLLAIYGDRDAALALYDELAFSGIKALPERTHHFFLRMSLCDWRDVDACRGLLADALAEPEPERLPLLFPLLSFPIEIDERDLLKVARRHARRLAMVEALPPVKAERKARLRLGYASSDYHDHATMHLMRTFFRLHERERFEIFAYSWGPDDASEYRRQAIADMDSFVDVRGWSAADIAKRIRDDGIDILIDLKGYTRDCLSQIFAYRPAPLQIQYLGYPGSMGADFIDYVISDRVVTPPQAAVAYSEGLAWMPHSYQVNDSTQEIDAERPDRAACGLPAEGVVYTCFCSHYKIDPLMFGLWMNILHQVPGSVLWLCGGSPSTERNLRTEAEKRGIAPDRLVFGKVWPKARHLARLTNADLFLDTYWYNGHTTASDALWAGVPVISVPGSRFASRVGASLLHAVEMDELIAPDFAAYERLAVELGLDASRRQALREKLAAKRQTAPLFDTRRFVRDIEQVYSELWEKKLNATENEQ